MKTNLTEIIFLLDRSGSMAGLERDTIGGFNSFIERQTKLEGDTVVTTVLFDDKYEIICDGVPAEDARLTSDNYFVRGTTALLDAIGKTIVDVGLRLVKTKEDERPSNVIFVITTDGMENASRKFSYEKVEEMIRHQKERYNWEFIFLGANIDSKTEADSIGIDVTNAYNFEATTTGVEKMYDFVCDVVAEKRQSVK
ncbi:MAG: vWA domain-containing protein [Anaerobacillus sp.]|uniref:vWA domain-containing protein n=1 Tax=Anaerobacillus sp. TaxID=1872506 RepID=UPI00391C0C9A